jgi:multiple sugar transport system permease protein
LAKPPEWVGFHNYERMFGNPLFMTAWYNSFVFLGLSVLLGFMVPVILALMVNELRRLRPFFQTIV